MGIKNTEMETGLHFDNSFIQQLEGFYIPTSGDNVKAPKIIKLNHALADDLGLIYCDQDSDQYKHNLAIKKIVLE